MPKTPDLRDLATSLIDAVDEFFVSFAERKCLFGAGLLLAMPVAIVVKLSENPSLSDIRQSCRTRMEQYWEQIPGSENLLLPQY
jgi:hypothetical protein